MKHFLLWLFFLLLFVSCTFDSMGRKINRYDSPSAALLIMDVQEDFTGPEAKMPVDSVQAELMIENLNTIINSGASPRFHIIYIQNVFPRNDIIANFFRHNAAVEGHQGISFDERLLQIEAPVFRKSVPDAFSNTDFEKYLIKNRIDTLYLTGVFADQCVFWTAKSALNRGYSVNYIIDAVASGKPKKVDKVADEISRAGADLLYTIDLKKP